MLNLVACCANGQINFGIDKNHRGIYSYMQLIKGNYDPCLKGSIQKGKKLS